MIPVNPEAIGVFGLFVTVICFGLEQIGVGVGPDTDHAKLQRTLAHIALVFGCACQLFTGIWMYTFSVGGDHSAFLGTIFCFFGLFWLLVALFFLKGGDKKVMAHFFLGALVLVVLFTIEAINLGMMWPLGADLIVIDVLLVALYFNWSTGKPVYGKIAGVCNLVIAFISFFLLYPHVLG